MTDKKRERFDALRAKYVAQKARLDEREGAFRARYGSTWERSWLTRGEETTLDRIEAARDKARRRFFDYIQSISPRDWSYGVPYRWIAEDLPYEDAVRPLGEKLSVVPPLAYGATEHRT